VKAGTKQVDRNADGTFPKGVSGNVKGLPRGTKHMTTILKEALRAVSDDGGTTEDKQIVKGLIDKAKSGDVPASKLIFNYSDGLPPQDIDVTTLGEKLEGIHLTVVKSK